MPAEFLATLSVDQREVYWRQEIPLGKQQVALVKLGDAVLGWVSYGPSRDADALPGAAEIWAVYVAPEHWSTGAGCHLWEHARVQLIQQGFQSVSLWVLANNRRAIDFYDKAGFAPDIASTKEFTLGGTTLTEVCYIASLRNTAAAGVAL